eukprot:g19899.t1
MIFEGKSLDDLETRVLQMKTTLENSTKTITDAETIISSFERRLAAQKRKAEKGTTTKPAAAEVARSIEPFEPEIKSLERRCGMIDAEVQGLALWQHGSTEKFEEHSLKFQQQKSDLQKLQAEIDARGGYLEEIQSELATQQRKIVRIDGNVDVMQKYFTGLGKGLQDPRSWAQSATTPATGLPTLCGSGSPRRRPWSSKEVRTRGETALERLEAALGPQARLLATSAEALLPCLEERLKNALMKELQHLLGRTSGALPSEKELRSIGAMPVCV